MNPQRFLKKILVKSVHFKKTVARSSFISKLWYILFNITSADFFLMSADVVLKCSQDRKTNSFVRFLGESAVNSFVSRFTDL